MNIAGEGAGLNLSAQNLTIILTMLHLPPRFRERLESKMRETKQDYKFTREDTTTPYSLVREEMLSLYPEIKQNHSFVTSPSIADEAITSGTSSNYRTLNTVYGSRNQPRGREAQNNRQQLYRNCLYCNGNHEGRVCQQYDTPQKRRDRLVVINRCRACMKPMSFHESECNPNAKCSNHPEETHYWHLCDGPNSIHPGKQTIATGQA